MGCLNSKTFLQVDRIRRRVRTAQQGDDDDPVQLKQAQASKQEYQPAAESKADTAAASSEDTNTTVTPADISFFEEDPGGEWGEELVYAEYEEDLGEDDEDENEEDDDVDDDEDDDDDDDDYDDDDDDDEEEEEEVGEEEAGSTKAFEGAADGALSFGMVETDTTAVESSRGGRRRRRRRKKKRKGRKQRQPKTQKKSGNRNANKTEPTSSTPAASNSASAQQPKPASTGTSASGAWGGNTAEAQQRRKANRALARIDAAKRQLQKDRARARSVLSTAGAASGGKVWIVISAIFQQAKSNLEFMRLSAETPPPRWQRKCLTRLQDQLGTVMRGRTDGVRDVIAKQFAAVGWNCRTRGPNPNATRPPSLSSIMNFLVATIHLCASKEKQRKQMVLRNIEPTQNELRDLAEACDRLWDLDKNRFEAGKDYRLDLQHKTYQSDRAPGPLFTFVDEGKMNSLPTYRRFLDLLDNYEWEPGVVERKDAEEEHEERAFIDACMGTPCMVYCYKYLVASRKFQGSARKFAQHLKNLWFDGYKRGRGRGRGTDSSPFEHVFVGEGKKERDSREMKIIGMHNWMTWYEQEKAGRFDYYGFKKPRGRRPRSLVAYAEEQILSIVFTWNGALKPVSTGFIGVSPEFELALYTLCFMAGKENNPCELGPYAVSIECYRFRGNKIGSIHPHILPTTLDEAATRVQSVVRGNNSRRRGGRNRRGGGRQGGRQN